MTTLLIRPHGRPISTTEKAAISLDHTVDIADRVLYALDGERVTAFRDRVEKFAERVANEFAALSTALAGGAIATPSSSADLRIEELNLLSALRTGGVRAPALLAEAALANTHLSIHPTYFFERREKPVTRSTARAVRELAVNLLSSGTLQNYCKYAPAALATLYAKHKAKSTSPLTEREVLSL